MDSDVLQEVPSNEIPQILETLKKDWPKSFLLHQYITIMEEYKKKKIEFSQNLYRSETIEDGVYVVKTSFKIQENININFFIYSAAEDLSQMSKVLMETSVIPWNPRILFEITFSKFSLLTVQAAASKGVTLDMANNYMLWIHPEQEIESRPVPDDLCLKFLDDSHVPEVNQNWPHRSPGSEEYLAQEIRTNFGLGLFRKSDNKMLSSSLHFHSGGIFVLYTDKDNRGKGYAEIIVCNMVKEIRQRGRIPFCTILQENIPSQNLFRKIGFKDFTTVHFIFPDEFLK